MVFSHDFELYPFALSFLWFKEIIIAIVAEERCPAIAQWKLQQTNARSCIHMVIPAT